MTTADILTIIVSILVPMITLFIWILCRMDKGFESLRIELKEIRSDIARLNVQVGKLETRVEERTLRAVHYDHEATHQ
jgi:hypothetical protein